MTLTLGHTGNGRCDGDHLYASGEVLAVTTRARGIDPARVVSAECSVLWFTEGKGDEDLGIHHFVRRCRGYFENQIRPVLTEDTNHWIEDRVECRLPPSPLSYRGHLITLSWCVRWRVQLDDADDVLTEVPFHLTSEKVSDTFSETSEKVSDTFSEGAFPGGL